MAILKNYVCSKCGYEVLSSPTGHFAISKGECFQFHCHNCSSIVSLSAEELYQSGFEIKCPECGQSDDLYNWNPIDGVCPKCGIPMQIDESVAICMD